MTKPKRPMLVHLLLCLFLGGCVSAPPPAETAAVSILEDDRLLTCTVRPDDGGLQFHWKNAEGLRYGSLSKLKEAIDLRGDSLHFAVNGGMYDQDGNPQGLYMEAGKALAPLDTIQEGYGNFYLQPNGVFGLLEDGTPFIESTTSFQPQAAISYATQSGPMLVIDGALHPAFNEGSPNVHIRNGVGILPDGRLLFAMSKEKMNFFDFATFFRANGCQQALYLDGFVSRTWLPEKSWRQTGGDFGVIIALTSRK